VQSAEPQEPVQVDPAKQIRKLTKKLKQIEGLKEKQGTLNPDQVKKIEQEPELRRELEVWKAAQADLEANKTQV